MKQLKLKLANWLLHSEGFRFAALKAEDGATIIEGDKDLLKYVDVSGFFFNKKPLRRFYHKNYKSNRGEPIKKLNKEQLKQVGLTKEQLKQVITQTNTTNNEN